MKLFSIIFDKRWSNSETRKYLRVKTNALLMGKCLMAVFVRVFAQKVTANICPIELLVRHFYLVYL